MDGIWLLLGLVFLIPIIFIIYVLRNSFNNSEKDNTVNPSFRMQNSDDKNESDEN